MWMLASVAAVFSANAQVTLNDKSNAVDLGYGVEISDFLSTAATTTITGEELRQTSATNLAEALYGRLPALTAFMQGGFSGDESKGANFNIRGYHTLNDKSILILVDGYERPIDRLAVEEVESVTVLKDAAATALLGFEGTNGAILVTTKHGKTGAPRVTVNYSHKFEFDPSFADMVGGYDYAKALNRARANDGLAAAYTDGELERFRDGSDPFMYPDINWRDLTFKNRAEQDHGYVTVTGGSDRVRYYANIDYVDSRGALKDTKQTDYNSQLRQSKANIRTNLDFTLTSTTAMNVNLLGIFQETKGPASMTADNIANSFYRLPATAFPFKTSTGLWGGNEFYGDANPAAAIQESGYSKSHQRQLWVNGKLSQKLDFITPGLSIFISGAYANSSIIRERKSRSHQYGYEYYVGGAIGDPGAITEVVYGDKNTDYTFSNWTDSQWWIANGALGINWKHSFLPEDHFSATFLYDTKGESRDGRGHTYYRHNLQGIFHYDYANRYLADLVLAGNGSNRCYPSKWAFSPVLSLGYIYANNPEGVLNYGKVRASGAIQHTDYMPTYGMWLPVWDASHGYFVNGLNYSSSWGASLGSFPTTDFTQETAKSVNVGTDIRLFGVLDFTADAFYQKNSHIMLSADNENSYVVGIQSAYNDVGEVESYGFELSAKYAAKLTDDLWVNAGAALSWNHNKVTKYIGTPTYPLTDPVGHRVNEAWGYRTAGFFADAADIAASNRQEFSDVRPGDIKYVDMNGDKVINEFDKVSLGKASGLPELNYQFNIGIEWRGFGLNAWFQGAGDYVADLRNVTGVWNVMGASNNNLSKEYYTKCWDVAGASASYPRLTTLDVSNNRQESDVWSKTVHFLKMRNCELYYRLPAAIAHKAGMQNARVFVQGANLLSFDNLDAMDAEMPYNTYYPAFKSINVGLNVTF